MHHVALLHWLVNCITKTRTTPGIVKLGGEHELERDAIGKGEVEKEVDRVWRLGHDGMDKGDGRNGNGWDRMEYGMGWGNGKWKEKCKRWMSEEGWRRGPVVGAMETQG